MLLNQLLTLTESESSISFSLGKAVGLAAHTIQLSHNSISKVTAELSRENDDVIITFIMFAGSPVPIKSAFNNALKKVKLQKPTDYDKWLMGDTHDYSFTFSQYTKNSINKKEFIDGFDSEPNGIKIYLK